MEEAEYAARGLLERILYEKYTLRPFSGGPHGCFYLSRD